jgi:hypothetical protein
MLTHLLSLIDAFCAARRISEARASTLIFNGGARISQIRAGADIGIRRAEEAVRWLSENWPEGAEWPADVPRPERVDHSADASE